MNKIILVLIVVAVVIIGGVLVWQQLSKPSIELSEDNQPLAESPSWPTPEGAYILSEEAKEWNTNAYLARVQLIDIDKNTAAFYFGSGTNNEQEYRIDLSLDTGQILQSNSQPKTLGTGPDYNPITPNKWKISFREAQEIIKEHMYTTYKERYGDSMPSSARLEYPSDSSSSKFKNYLYWVIAYPRSKDIDYHYLSVAIDASDGHFLQMKEEAAIPTAQKETLEIRTDKLSYEQKEGIKIIVENSSVGDICYRAEIKCGWSFWILQRQKNSQWENISLPTPCLWVAPPFAVELETGRNIQHTWNGNMGVSWEESEYPAPGTYRFSFAFWPTCEDTCENCRPGDEIPSIYSEAIIIE